MSSEKTAEDLNTSVGELAVLMNDTFTCCMRNYEALLPYLQKKETKPKIYHKLLQINILLNKLNEELVGLRVEYVTVSSYEQKRDTVLPVGGRKRKTSDTSELGCHGIKSTKTELPYSSNTKYSILSSESAVSMQSDKSDTKEARHTHVQKSVMHSVKNIKTEIVDLHEVESFLEIPVVTQTSYDTTKNAETVCFVGDEESIHFADSLIGCNANNKPANNITQIENNEVYVPLQNVECETSSYVLCKDHDTCKALEREVRTSSLCHQANRPFNSKESSMLLERRMNSGAKEKKGAPHSPIRYKNDNVNYKVSEKRSSAEKDIYGIIRQNGKFKCTLCNRELLDFHSVQGHVKGKKHKSKQMTSKENSCSKKSKVPSSVCESKAPVSMHSDVSCLLDESVEVVQDQYQVVSMKHAVRLDDLWEYFDAALHINKKFFRIHSGLVTCYLCNEQLGRYVHDVKKHICRFHHFYRINVLTDIELKIKSSNEQSLDIPGFLKGIIPMSQFSLKGKGFYCNVCNCFCKNEVVLSHMTGLDHGRTLREMGKSSVEITNRTSENENSEER